MRWTLVPHPDTPPGSIKAVEVELYMNDGNEMLLCYEVLGPGLVLPEWVSPERADGLWKTTCFELFLRSLMSDAYQEFNFSPSSQWAAYAFDGYRSGMKPIELSLDPHIQEEPESRKDGQDAPYVLGADVDLAETPPGPLLMALSAVIEEEGGRKSYWALAHPPGAPDFHHPDCFTIELPAAGLS